jgi:ABC-type uncharacterized transport system permease subunit
MTSSLALSLSALAALAPASIVGIRGQVPRPLFWSVVAIALVGPAVLAVVAFAHSWHGTFWAALWVSVAATMVAFAGLALLSREAQRLMPLLLPYLFSLGVVATIWTHVPEPQQSSAPGPWLVIHIGVAVATYALVTLAAVAGLAVLLQERAMKCRRPTRLTEALPSIVDAESLEVRLLATAEVILGIGLLTGMGLQYAKSGHVLELDHKTLLTVLAFLVIAAVLAVRQSSGLRGRRAARWVLVAYLLLTLGYIGVKFVTSVVMA